MPGQNNMLDQILKGTAIVCMATCTIGTAAFIGGGIYIAPKVKETLSNTSETMSEAKILLHNGNAIVMDIKVIITRIKTAVERIDKEAGHTVEKTLEVWNNFINSVAGVDIETIKEAIMGSIKALNSGLDKTISIIERMDSDTVADGFKHARNILKKLNENLIGENGKIDMEKIKSIITIFIDAVIQAIRGNTSTLTNAIVFKK